MHKCNRTKWISLRKFLHMIKIIDKNLKSNNISIRDRITDNKNFLIMLIIIDILKDLMRMVLKKYQFQNKIKILIFILQNPNTSFPFNNKDNNMSIIIINNININKILINKILTNQSEILSKGEKEWMNNLQILNFRINLIFQNNIMKRPKKIDFIIKILIKDLLEMRGR